MGHGVRVEHSVVLDQAFEAGGPLTLDPVHHIAAIGGAERAGVAGVELRILLPRRGEAKFQVLQRLAAPILVDAVGEGLAIAGRSVEIDGDDRSEEHTSELQSLMRISYAVFCLKKKKKT